MLWVYFVRSGFALENSNIKNPQLLSRLGTIFLGRMPEV